MTGPGAFIGQEDVGAEAMAKQIAECELWRAAGYGAGSGNTWDDILWLGRMGNGSFRLALRRHPDDCYQFDDRIAAPRAICTSKPFVKPERLLHLLENGPDGADSDWPEFAVPGVLSALAKLIDFDPLLAQGALQALADAQRPSPPRSREPRGLQRLRRRGGALNARVYIYVYLRHNYVTVRWRRALSSNKARTHQCSSIQDGKLNDERGVQAVAEEAGLHLHRQPRQGRAHSRPSRRLDFHAANARQREGAGPWPRRSHQARPRIEVVRPGETMFDYRYEATRDADGWRFRFQTSRVSTRMPRTKTRSRSVPAMPCLRCSNTTCSPGRSCRSRPSTARP